MVKQCVHVQANSNLFRVTPKTVVFVTLSPVRMISNVAMEFVAVDSVQLLAEIKMIVPMVNIAQTIDV